MMGNCCKHIVFDRNRLSRRHRKKIVLLLVGLDNAGKTSAAKSLIGDSLESVVPTVGFSTVSLQYRGYNVVIYDLGGGTQIRGIWQRYFVDVHGVIFVVDASDVARLEECAQVLEDLLTNDKLAGKPVLLLANKQDNEGALDELDVVERLGLEELVNRQRCPTMVETCSTRLDTRHVDPAIQNGFTWLVSNIIQDYHILNARVESDLTRQKVLDEEVRRERRERVLKLRELRGDKVEEESVITMDPFQPITKLTSGRTQPMTEQKTMDIPELDSRIILVQESPKRFDLTGSPVSNSVSARMFDNDTKLEETRRPEVESRNDRNANLTDYVKGQLEMQKTRKKKNPLRRANKTAPVDSDSDTNSLAAGDTVRSRPLTPLMLTPGTLTPRTLTPGTLTPRNLTPGTLTPCNLTPGTLTPLPRKPGVLPPLRVPADPFIVRPSSGSNQDSAWGLDKPLDGISTNHRASNMNPANQLADISSDSEDVVC